MRTQSVDTSPEFERIQIARIRAFSVAKKFTSIRSWTQSMAYANLETTPGSSPQDRAMEFVAREYGSHLAHLFAHAIETQHPWNLQAPDIQEATLPIIKIAEQIGIPILIMGSMASSIYGFPRSIQDVDFLANFNEDHIAFLCDHLKHTYAFDPDEITLALLQRESFSVLHRSRLIKIDVILPSTALEKEALERRQPHMLIEGSAPLFLPSPEDMTLLNLIDYQRQENAADDRWNDILGLLKVQAPTINVTSLCQRAAMLGIAALLSQALIDAGIHSETPVS
ncbi:hypothetical protein [Dictyobacter kobayashii]|uniref:Nucleotidyltransferase n=1 Tax=Dictyobacter kobayashii TaxID=2014872 RepID=A0A402ADH4_9CHLR|nr:hypothetical protein [Dictyobacter kobayashii]GCE17141.1 hypothetical protein KDK_09410 [Dictyobacter kobayashii]